MQLPSKDDLFGYYQSVSSKVKQYVRNLTPLEQKVMDATSNEPWGPHGTVMAEITRSLYSPEDFRQIMGALAKRLQDEGEDWRHVYKSLLLMEYMSKHGPQRVVDELNSNIYIIERLQRFEYKDKNGKDWGLNVRQRAKELHSLITDSERLKRERQKAMQNESKYTGVTAEEAKMGKGFGSSQTNSWNREADKSYFGGKRAGNTGSIANQGFGSSSFGGRLQDDHDSYDAGHQALKLDDSDEDHDTKAATQKRIAALKVDASSSPRKGSPLKGGRAQAASSTEAKGPKRLSQIQVDPSIAASLGKLKPPSQAALSRNPKPAEAQPAMFFDTEAESMGPKVGCDQAAAPSSTDNAWDAFVDTQDANPTKSSLAGLDELLGEPIQTSHTNIAAQSAIQDPFSFDGLGSQPAAPPPADDPFASFSSAPAPKTTGSLPLAPQKKAETDPFASISSVGTTTSQQLKDLRPATSKSPKSSLASPAQSFQQSGPTLPDDFFSMTLDSPKQQKTAQVGDASWNMGLFQSATPVQQTSSRAPMAPNLPKVALPPVPDKRDPFAGLSGF